MRNRHKERPAQVYVEYSSSSGSDESDQEVKKPTRKKKVAPLEEIISEDQIKARVEELYEKKIAEDEQRKADEKEREEEWLKVRKEAEETYKAELQKALADQAVAFKKEEDAAEAELARQQQWRRDTEEAVRSAMAAKNEADRQAAEDRMRELREKEEADRSREAGWNAEVAQGVENTFAARMKKQADDLEAADKAQTDKAAAENTEKVIKLTKKRLTLYESRNESKGPSKTPGSRKMPRDKNKPKTIATPKETGNPDGPEDNVAQLKELVGIASTDDNLGQGAAFLEELDSRGDTDIESLRVEVSGRTRSFKGTVGQRKEANSPKEGKRNGKSTRKAKGEEAQYRDVRSKKKGTSGNQKPVMYVMRWFAGSSYM